jgi:hypothetical protein
LGLKISNSSIFIISPSGPSNKKPFEISKASPVFIIRPPNERQKVNIWRAEKPRNRRQKGLLRLKIVYVVNDIDHSVLKKSSKSEQDVIFLL